MFFSEEYQYSAILKWGKRYFGIKLPLALNACLKKRVKILVNFSDLVNLTIGSGFMHTLYHLWQTWTDCSQHCHWLLFAWGAFLSLLFPMNKEEKLQRVIQSSSLTVRALIHLLEECISLRWLQMEFTGLPSLKLACVDLTCLLFLWVPFFWVHKIFKTFFQSVSGKFSNDGFVLLLQKTQ